MGLSPHSLGENFLRNNEKIKEVLERELNVGSILHYGRRLVYEHLRRQRHLIARSISIVYSSIRL